MWKETIIMLGLNALKALLESKPEGKALAFLKSEKVKKTISDIYTSYQFLVK
jgi:hypothetical protein